MATRDEKIARWNALPADQQGKISDLILGHPDGIIKDLLNHCVANPRADALLCDRLGLQTEEERVASATIDSAEYAKRSFNVSIWALVVAVLSAVLAVIALLK